MKKIKDFLREINQILGIPEIDGWIAAENLNDVEVTDPEAVAGTLKNLLTFEAAKNNTKLKAYFKQQIYDSAKGELLGVVDTRLVNTVRDLYGEEAASEIEAIDFTADKIKKFSELALNDRSKNADVKSKDAIESLRKQLDKNQEVYDRKIKEKDDAIKKLADGYESRLVNSEIKRRINSKQFADKFSDDDLKDVLSQTAVNRISKEAIIKLSEDGNLIAFNPEQPDMKLFMDGREVTVDTLIDKHIGKYLAKSEPTKEKIEVTVKDGARQTTQQPVPVTSLAAGIRARRDAGE